MEVFDQFAQFLCNRYPLNSKARKLGPTNTLNDVDVPVRAGVEPVKLSVDTVGTNRAVVRPYPFDRDPLTVSFTARLVPNRRYKNGEDFLAEFYPAEQITITHTLASA
jgi:hypothetical protein